MTFNKRRSRRPRKRRYKKKHKALSKQVKSNKRAIDKLEDAQETKYLTAQLALGPQNYCGQNYVIGGVDAIGNYNQLGGLDKYNPSLTGSVPVSYNWQPACFQPLRCTQGVGEQQRVGEYIKMKWLNLKGTISAWNADCNGTNAQTNFDYSTSTRSQRVKMIVVLDKAPPVMNLASQTAWNAGLVPCTLFNNKLPAYYGTNPYAGMNKPYLREAANLTGVDMANADGTNTPWNRGYWNDDYVTLSDKEERRFKILKVVNFKPVQQELPGEVNDLPSKRHFSVTIKAPYKFQYNSNTQQMPTNQNILVFFCSDSVIPITTLDECPNICLPSVICQAKLAYSDS